MTTTFAAWFHAATGNPPYPYQERLAQEAALPDVLEVPTGGGKTQAVVLAFLYRRLGGDETLRTATPRRLVFVEPMRALVEQTAAAARTAVERLVRAGLLASPVPVYVAMGGEPDGGWETDIEREVIVVGTQDMVLSRALNRGYALPRTRWPMAAGALSADCLFVWDEVQLLGSGLATSRQLAAARRRFGTFAPCADLWLSATVEPRLLATVDNPAPDPEGEGWRRLAPEDLAHPALRRRMEATRRIRRLSLPPARRGARGEGDAGRMAALAEHVRRLTEWRRAQDPTLLVVVNTVRRAQALYDALGGWAEAEGVDLLLAHSRFRGLERGRLAASLARSGANLPPRVVVATQVLEAGVDITSAHLVTEIAPWASLVQRMGRVNRDGGAPGAWVEWVDLAPDEASPYTPEALDPARAWLEAHEGESVTPAALTAAFASAPAAPAPLRAVLRMSDLFELADTTPELAGADIDVGRFVRGFGEEPEVALFWRPKPDEGTAPAWPTADELCPAPLYEARRLPFAGRAWQPDATGRRWVVARDLVPGGTYWLEPEVGGYSPARGFDADERAPVPSIPGAGGADPVHTPEGDRVSANWVTLDDHARDTRRELLAVLDRLAEGWPDLAPYRPVLELAALLHDRGKALDVFQNALSSGRGGGPPLLSPGRHWAKAPALGRYARPHFRHEAAGALALLAAPPPALATLPEPMRTLVVYLVASHHGRVRLTIRAHPDEPQEEGAVRVLGLEEGLEVPATDLGAFVAPAARLSLEPAQLGEGESGPSWVERMSRRLQELGPFRLYALELLVRVTDWRASAREARGDPAASAGTGGM
ncbi:MAG: CRISPR-associated endonuclease Cas3'' [Firmicutes bacterium]|nr:CRISPR-associated endonuclease Cas3'' [Bacillota bacterium]